ncbi:MAG: TerC family protein [Chitinophagales bacterium]|nr:TerC family protein [Chitinophagales bacterium]MDW8273756.1 TerC family protein [Chitinophagales bacterium]
MDYDFSVFLHADAWISFITLTFLEIVLGIDNIIFISIVTSRLPQHQQKMARNLGLTLALVFRIILLLAISWIIGLTAPLFAFAGHEISGRDIILIAGGFFLIAKSTIEIHKKVTFSEEEQAISASASFIGIIIQIILLDMVFSFDSILTAVGLTQHVIVMIFAVIISIIVMMLFAGSISKIIHKYPTLQILALAFLIMIGLTLILEGFEVHVNKAFVYVAVLFSLSVELLNLRFRAKVR